MLCIRCKENNRKKHFNAKYCHSCACFLRSRPAAAKITTAQKKLIKIFAGKIYVKDLAEKCGISKSSLKRYCNENGININSHRYSKKDVDRVIKYYLKNSLPACERKFKDINSRSIIDRYLKGTCPKTEYWSDEHILKLAKFAGIMSYMNQALHIGKPNATAASVKSSYYKKLGSAGHNINGMAYHIGRYFVKKSCPIYQTGFCVGDSSIAKKIIFWIDAYEHMRDDIPDHIKHGFRALSRFQLWLHGSKESLLNILNLETYNASSIYTRKNRNIQYEKSCHNS